MITEKQILDRIEQGFSGSFAGPEAIGKLHRRLAARAERQGLLDVSYRTVDSPLGPLLLAATGEGLVRVAFSREDHESVLSRLASEISPRILRTPRRLDEPARQLEEYFAGKRRAFTLPVDLRLAHEDAAGRRSRPGSSRGGRAPYPEVLHARRRTGRRQDPRLGGGQRGADARRDP